MIHIKKIKINKTQRIIVFFLALYQSGERSRRKSSSEIIEGNNNQFDA